MAIFKFKSFQQIFQDMLSTMLSKSGVNDTNPGSVLSTFIEAPSQEDAQQYFQMYQIIKNYNLDTTEGDDLEKRALEFGLNPSRLSAQKATGVVTITDTSISPIKTKIYAGDRGPISGQSYVDVNNASAFTPSGTVIVGRDTENAETVSYSSITNYGSFFRLTLIGNVSNDHGTDESVVLSQGNDRVISAGTVVRVPSSDTSEEVTFILSDQAVILDGESSVSGVEITAVLAGTISNVPAGTIIEFDSKPFSSAEVVNEFSIKNGTDRETDTELRSRIKAHIQGLSKGVKAAILSGIAGVSSSEDNKRVVSANLVEPITLDDMAFLYIDDGTGLEPSSSGQGNEVLIQSATGGEKFLQLDFFPVIKAQLTTQSSQPYEVINGDTLIISVNGVEETITFGPDDFIIPGAMTAYEIARAINQRLTLVEARTASSGSKVVIRAKDLLNETLQIVGGSANAADKLNFSTIETNTISLYKYDGDTLTLLSKDGNTAYIESSADGPFNLVGGETLTVIIDGKSANPQTITFQAGDFALIGNATATEVAARINIELAGAAATVTSANQKVTITSNTLRNSDSKIEVVGGTANAILLFDTNEVSGVDIGFSLNRFNGQLELATPAIVGDLYETASTRTRGFVVGANAQPFDLANSDTLTISVDGGIDKTATFNTSDFSNIDAATAAEVANVINTDIEGAHAEATDDGRVLVRTNTWNPSLGSIQVTSATTAAIGFDTSLTRNSQNYHVATIASQNDENYSFTEGQSLVVVLDKTPITNTYSIVMDLDGVVTIGASLDTFIAYISTISQNFNLKFPNNDDLAGFTVKWLDCTNIGNNGVLSTIQSYDGSTGEMVLAAPLASSITVGDTFTIIPVTAKNVVTYLSNTITSSLPSKADVESVENGAKVQITSKTVGASGGVQVAGGSANTVLNFTTSQIEGSDGYEYYTGILRKVQYVVNGLDADLTAYPGLAASGVQIEVLPPIVRLLSFEIDLIFSSGVTPTTVHDKVISAVSEYVNGLGVGEDVVLNEIVDKLMDVDGIADIRFISPANNVPIADNEIARVSENDIVFG